MYYTSIEGLTLGVLAANAPYGTTYSSPAPPIFSNPFVTASNGQNLGQYFPVTFAPLNSSSSHPDGHVDWSQYVPISGIPAYPVSNRIPYTEQYMFSIERQLGDNTVFSASYVGNQSHRLIALVESNPGRPRVVPELEPAQPGCRGIRDLRSFRRKQCLHNGVGTNCEWNPRAPRAEIWQRYEPGDHRQFQLQRAGTQSSPHQQAPAVICQLHFQQINRSVLERRRGGESNQSRTQPRLVGLRCET